MTVAVLLIIAVALLFDYINGFHDAANSIATVVSTRVLSPGKAVIWAAFFNFIAAFVFGTAVAKTVGAGMIDIQIVTFGVIFIGLVLGLALMVAIHWILRWTPPSRVDRWFRRLQLVSAAGLSLNHGGNDAQ